MGANSKIEWTKHTFNPWRGCTKVAAGCANCYAEALSHRNPATLGVWGPDGTRVVASEAMWREPAKWDRAAKEAGERHRVFCASLADVFENWDGAILTHDGGRLFINPDGEWMVTEQDAHRTPYGSRFATMDDVRRRLFALIDATPNLDWLLVTKRPANIKRMWVERTDVPYVAEAGRLNDCARNRRENVWLLTSMAEQKDADANIPELLKCRGLVPVLGVSAEPLLGPIDFTRIPTGHWAYGKVDVMSGYLCGSEPDEMRDYESDPSGATRKQPGEWERGKFGLDWVIVGGESGPDARPAHPDWVRSIRDQCQAAGVPFFFKQWGEWMPVFHGIDPNKGDPNCRIRKVHRDGDQQWWSVGKKAAGRLLDGREWNELPEVSHA